MKDKFKLAALLAALGSPGFAQSGVIDGAFAGCLTKDLLSEFLRAAVNDDMRQLNALLNSGCFNIDGREYSVVSRGFVQSQVRIFVGNDSVLLWTVSEAVRR